MTKTKNIVIYGTGGLGRGVVDLIESINNFSSSPFDILGFVDDSEKNIEVNGLRVFGDSNFLLNYPKDINVVLAFGSPNVKRKIYNVLSVNKNLHFPNLIHPDVDVSKFNLFGIGNIISKGVALSTNITINNFNLVHYNCSIGHDVSMGNYNSVFPLTALSGYDRLGDCVEIGTNTAVIPSISFGDNSIVGAGSTIIEDVCANTKVVGVPGKEI